MPNAEEQPAAVKPNENPATPVPQHVPSAARNSPGTEAFPHSLDSPEGTLMVATTRNQKPTAIRSFVRQTLGFNYN